jgi:diguanylate cyclase (GGDEF)-like protein/PAS domain S-box-containing protein
VNGGQKRTGNNAGNHKPRRIHLTTSVGPAVGRQLRAVDALRGTALVAAYAGIGWLSGLPTLGDPAFTALTLAPGLALAALVLWGLRLTPAVALGALISAFLGGASAVVALAAAAGASASAAGGAWLLSRIPDFSPRLERPRHILILVAVGAFLAPIASATVVALAHWIDAPVDAAWLLLDWTLMWTCNALGVMLVAPLVLTWAAGPMRDAPGARTLESMGLSLLQILAHACVFLTHSGPATYVGLALALLAALYLGLRWVSVTNVVTVAIAIVGTAQGLGPFALSAMGGLLHLVSYGLIASLTTLMVSSLAAERRRVGVELEEAAVRFRQLAALSSDWFWEQDENLRFIYISHGYEDRAGLRGDDSLGKTRFELGNVFESEDQRRTHEAVLAARRPFRGLEVHRRGIDGEWRYVSVSGEPILDASGRFRGYRGVGHDITEKKLAERALRLSEERLRSLVNLSSDWYWEQDEEGRFTMIAGRAADERRVRPELLLGKTRWEIERAGMPDAERARYEATIAARQPFYDFVMTSCNVGEEPRDVAVSGEPIFDEDGAFRGYRGTARDVTLELRAQREIEDARSLLQSLIDAIPTPVAVKDEQHRFIAANDAFCTFVHNPRAEFVGKTDYDYFTPEEAAFFQETDAAALRGEPVEYERPYRLGGETRWMLVRKRGLRGPDGSRLVALLMLDVTERKAAIEQLQASEQRFRSLAGLSADWYWEQDAQLRFTYVSDDTERKTPTPPSELIGKTRFELENEFESPAAREEHRQTLLARRPFRKLRLRDRVSGRAMLVSGEPIVDAQGNFTGYRGIGQDISRQVQAEQRIARLKDMYAAMTEANEAIIHSRKVDELLRAICRIAVEYGHFVFARVAMIDYQTGWIDTVAGAGNDGGHVARVRLSLDPNRVEGQGPSAYAIRTDTNYVCNDIATDGRTRPWREMLASLGIRAQATFLLRREAKTVGTLHLYAAQVGFFDEELTGLLEKLAANLSFALGNFQREEARWAAESALRESETRFRDFANAAGEYVWEVDLQGRYTYVSSRVQSVWGYSDQELAGKTPAEFMPPGEPERVREWLAKHMQADGSFRDLEHRIVTRTQEIRWVLINAVGAFDEHGQRTGHRGTGRDVTDRKTAEARISFLATRDPLTELPNRVLFNDRLEQGILTARRSGQSLALLFIDLDRFKNINDSLGHQVGDLLLKEVANRMHGCIRKGDTLSRLGGDEFVVTLEGLQHAEDAAQVAAKIIEMLARPFEIADHSLNTSCSIGISIFPFDADDDRTLMKNADTAMYHAKEKGRNNYQFFSPEMNVRAVERHTLETALRQAIEREEFVLHYQPQVDIRSGRVVGMEALLRWVHPERGLLAPATFIAVAEESGLIEPIGQWVLRSACQRAKAWLDAGYPPIRVAVNISARQLVRPREFSRGISRVLSAAGLDPHYLELEMTESLLLQNADENIAVLRKLGQEGVRIAVDDFGTGYSSLSYLRQLPIDKLKIDRTFVRDIESDPEDAAIIQAVVAMAHSLELQVTAEGVESRGQLEALARLGCDEYQGYLFSKPLPAAEAALKFLAPQARALAR